MATQRKIGKYDVNKILGSGTYGTVYMISDKNGSNYAAKKMEFSNADLNEINMVMRINHPHIIHGTEVIIEDEYIYLIEELGERLIDSLRMLTTPDKIKYIYELGSALHFLQLNEITHCDLKINNLLTINKRIILADLGLASYIDIDASLCEIIENRAPEYIMLEYPNLIGSLGLKSPNTNFDRYKGQIWTYGILCLDIIYGRTFAIQEIYSSNDEISIFKALTSKNFKDIIIGKLGRPSTVKLGRLLDLIFDKLLVINRYTKKEN